MEASGSLFRSALRFFSGTLISRCSGMVRDVVMAFYFGASAPLAAFLVAYRFVYLIRRLFGEGTLHQGIIPHFEAEKKIDPKKGALFFRDLFVSVSFFLGIFLFLLEIILLIFFPQEPSLFARWMLPGIFFICLFGVGTGLLQSEERFFLSASAPAVANFVWIIGMVCVHLLSQKEAFMALSCIISCAFFAQFLVIAPTLFRFLKKSLSLREIFQLRSPSKEIKQLIKPVFIAIFGVAAVQINTVVDGFFARYASLEGPAYLWYAVRLGQLPLSLFAVALSSALLPSLSKAYERGDEKQYLLLSISAQKKIVTLFIPCLIAIFVLGSASVALIFGRGKFNETSFFYTTICLWGYSLGLLPSALVQVIAPLYYAKKEYRLPAEAATISALINMGLNALFIFCFHWGILSIVLATSIASLFNFLFLYRGICKKGHEEIWKEGGKTTLAALLAGVATFYVGAQFLKDPTLLFLQGKSASLSSPVFSFLGQGIMEITMGQALLFGIQAFLFIGLFLGFCKPLKVRVWS